MSGVEPPVTGTDHVYAVPFVPFGGSAVPEIAGGKATCMANATDLEASLTEVAVTVAVVAAPLVGLVYTTDNGA